LFLYSSAGYSHFSFSRGRFHITGHKKEASFIKNKKRPGEKEKQDIYQSGVTINWWGGNATEPPAIFCFYNDDDIRCGKDGAVPTPFAGCDERGGEADLYVLLHD
jgi:hypothetical protein